METGRNKKAADCGASPFWGQDPDYGVLVVIRRDERAGNHFSAHLGLGREAETEGSQLAGLEHGFTCQRS